MEFNKIEPIYAQIIQDIRRKLFNGTYSLGQEIPSRRELAKTLGVNPNTIQRAYKEMEDMNLIVTHRGQGSYITSDATVLASLREEALHETIHQSMELLRSFGKSDVEILALIQSYLERGQSE